MTKRNENRQEYKKTKVGWIPETWSSTELKDVIVNGISNGVFNDPKKVGAGYKLINVIDLYSEPYIDIDSCKLLDIHENEFKRNQVLQGDIFFTRSSLKLEGIAHCNINLSNYNNVTFDGHVMKISPNKKLVDPLYLRLYCLTNRARRYFMQNAKQTTMTTIGQSEISKLPIPIPPLAEQKKIAQILSAWDRAIEQTRKLIEAKKRLKKGLMQQLLFGRIRFNEFQNSEGIQSTPFYEYPKDWTHPRIGEIANEVIDRNIYNKEVTVLSCSKYEGFVSSLEYFGKKIYSDDTSSYKIIKRWQFGFPANHVEEGSIGLLDHLEQGIVSPIYIIFQTEPGKVYPPFLYSLLKTNIFKHIFRVNTSASVDRRGSLRWKDFRRIRVPLPKITEQKVISSLLDKSEREIEMHELKLELIQKQKKGLMQKLLTGEIRVKVS
ncbi:MAG: restriction endonuclease subunit S [Calditrichaceae bacterium]|nr:restriction endonuclease subunit S [Calditrichaceae bacterium]MBN2707579.1 restriction endonuclease subunit S [Calditrichaceae bacterium]RQV95663.1 MAG: restriction endonuclease subunit S [Calditrichota bacterium]